jgi:hypothetical protein
MYYNVMTKTIMVIITSCSSQGEARRSLLAELNTVVERASCAFGKCNKHELIRRLEY